MSAFSGCAVSKPPVNCKDAQNRASSTPGPKAKNLFRYVPRRILQVSAMELDGPGSPPLGQSSFTKRFWQLVDSVVDPAWRTLLEMPWAIRATTLAAITAGLAFWQIPGLWEGMTSHLISNPPIAAQAGADRGFPDNAATEALTSRIGNMVRTEILQNPQDQTAWSLAQAMFSVMLAKKSIPSNMEAINSKIKSTAHNERFCWSEYDNEPDKPCALFISGWIFGSIPESNLSSYRNEIDKALELQTQSGAWPMFESTLSDRFLSTYTTAWMIVGLKAVRDARLDPALNDRIDPAIARACVWLVKNRESSGRWKSFPDLPYSRVSLSISGLVVHAIAEGCPDQIEAVADSWVDRLAQTTAFGDNDENGYIEIQTGLGQTNDHFVYFRIPWMMIAAIDAAEHSNPDRRAKATRFVGNLLARPEVQNADSDHRSWARAELLVALEYLAANRKNLSPAS